MGENKKTQTKESLRKELEDMWWMAGRFDEPELEYMYSLSEEERNKYIARCKSAVEHINDVMARRDAREDFWWTVGIVAFIIFMIFCLVYIVLLFIAVTRSPDPQEMSNLLLFEL